MKLKHFCPESKNVSAAIKTPHCPTCRTCGVCKRYGKFSASESAFRLSSEDVTSTGMGF